MRKRKAAAVAVSARAPAPASHTLPAPSAAKGAKTCNINRATAQFHGGI
jgi:hypothetical protein